MVKRAAILLSSAFLLSALISCQRLPSQRGEIELESAPYRDAIPSEYGDPIGVSSRADDPNWTQVWFVKPDKSIVVVFVNPSRGKIAERIVSIPRR